MSFHAWHRVAQFLCTRGAGGTCPCPEQNPGGHRTGAGAGQFGQRRCAGISFAETALRSLSGNGGVAGVDNLKPLGRHCMWQWAERAKPRWCALTISECQGCQGIRLRVSLGRRWMRASLHRSYRHQDAHTLLKQRLTFSQGDDVSRDGPDTAVMFGRGAQKRHSIAHITCSPSRRKKPHGPLLPGYFIMVPIPSSSRPRALRFARG